MIFSVHSRGLDLLSMYSAGQRHKGISDCEHARNYCVWYIVKLILGQCSEQWVLQQYRYTCISNLSRNWFFTRRNVVVETENKDISWAVSLAPIFSDAILWENKYIKIRIRFAIYNANHNQWRIQDFPEEAAPTPRGAPTYDFAKFSQKLHEIERIWTPGGDRASLASPLDPPLIIHFFCLWTSSTNSPEDWRQHFFATQITTKGISIFFGGWVTPSDAQPFNRPLTLNSIH